jgi:hypothetical protein
VTDDPSVSSRKGLISKCSCRTALHPACTIRAHADYAAARVDRGAFLDKGAVGGNSANADPGPSKPPLTTAAHSPSGQMRMHKTTVTKAVRMKPNNKFYCAPL